MGLSKTIVIGTIVKIGYCPGWLSPAYHTKDMSLVWIPLVIMMYMGVRAWVSDPLLMTSWRWRYNVSRRIDEASGAFVSVRMQVLDVSTPLWVLHSSAQNACTIVNQTQPVAVVTCDSPIHLIVQVSDALGMTDQFSILLESFIQELAWLVAADSPLVTNATTTLSIWLHDVLDEDAADAITLHMFESGEIPTVSFSSPSIQATGPVIFNTTRSRWVVPISVASIPSYTAIMIEGIGVSFMTYQAKDAYIPLFIQQFLPSWAAVSIPSTPPGSLRRHICDFSNMALLYPKTKTIAFTQDMFDSIQILRVPLDANETLVDIAFTRTTFVVLTTKRVLYSPDMISLSQANGVALNFNFTGAQLRASEMCDNLLQYDGSMSPNNNMLLLLDSDSLYASLDAGVNYHRIDFPSTTLKIVSAVLEYRKYLGITAVFRDTANTTSIYEYYNGSWTKALTPHFSVSTLTNAGFGSRNSFVIGLGGVLYTPNSGFSLNKLRMTARSPIGKPGLGDGEFVRQLITLPTGTSYAILTTMNRVFYGIIPLMEMIEVQSGITTNTSRTYLMLEPRGDIPGLKMIVANSTGIYSYEIPLEHELRGVRSSPTLESLSCPYEPLALPADQPSYIDMGNNVTVMTVLKENVDLQSAPIAVAVDDSNMLQISSSTVVSSSDLGNTEATNTAVVQEAVSVYNSRIDREGRATGSTSFSVKLLQGNHACGKVMTVTRVRVGCPSGTSILVRDSNNGPIRVFHQTSGYRPVIDLYSNGVLVEEMTGDYVLQELTGRTDHQYTATASQVGCISRPQSWERLKGVPWTPQNNIDCFAAATVGNTDSSDWMSASYEVINSTGKNMLKFKNQADDGFMAFQVTVVDLQYSYCNLSTVFTIELYGRPLDSLTAILTISGLAAFMLVVFIASYICYRREIMLNRKFD